MLMVTKGGGGGGGGVILYNYVNKCDLTMILFSGGRFDGPIW